MTNSDFEGSLAALRLAGINEQIINNQVRCLFSRSLQYSDNLIYLANHSLGRALDQTEPDILEGLSYWYSDHDKAWDYWLAEMNAFRDRIARLIHAPHSDCIVPKTNAGQGLRAILNCYDKPVRVITSADEFNSIDHILKIYAHKHRIDIQRVEPSAKGSYKAVDFIAAMEQGADLLAVSLVMFTTGQFLSDFQEVIEEAQHKKIRIIVDLYHAAGVIPLDVTDMNIDFAVGGCYKYLHGGPGACWLYIHPRHLDGSLQTLDSGWFAQTNPFAFNRPETPDLADDGNCFLESTPAILPFYQARAGLKLTLALGVERLRQYSLQQQQFLEQLLTAHGIAFIGYAGKRGAFIAMPHKKADLIVKKLETEGVICDAREGLLRFGPDLLNTKDELQKAVEQLARLWSV